VKAGDLVRVRGKRGIILEVPPEDDYWGETAKVFFFADGSYCEYEMCVLESLTPLKAGGYGIDPPHSLRGKKGRYSGKVER